MLQQLCLCQQEAACLLAEWSWTAMPSAIIHDISVIQSIIAVRNDVGIIDVCLTTLFLMRAQAAQNFTSIR